MVTAASWVLVPLVMYLVAAGLGLLAEWAARVELPDALLAPVGICLAVVLVSFVVELGGAGAVMGAALVVPALAGMLLRRSRLPARLMPGWPAAAALAAYALYLGPVLMSGHWTWLGYNFVNDTATHFVVAEHLMQHGTAEVTTESTRAAVVNGTIGQSYPLGAHALLAAFAWLVPVPIAAAYQPFIAALAGLAAMPLAWLATRLKVPGPVAAVVALVAVGANLTYQYALHGAFKEVALVAVVATAAAMCRFALDRRLPAGAVALAGACLAAGIGVFSAGAGAYAVGLAALAMIAVAVERPRQKLGRAGRSLAIGAVALVVAVSPILLDVLSFGGTASTVFAESNADLASPLQSPAVLGHLARPLPVYQSLGVWLRGDYRYPLEPGTWNVVLVVLLVLAAGLLAFAVIAEARRRRLGLLLVVGPALIVYLLAAPRLDPYAEAKLLVVLSPMIVFGVALGAWWLYRRLPAVGLVAGLVVVLGVLGSDALAYRDARLAPVDRLTALRDAAEEGAGRGPWLLPEWEELAKHFGDEARIYVASESFSPRSVVLREEQPIFNRSFDLDEMTLDYVTSWPGIMLRRSPEASRPPANYERTYRNAYYELWERREGPRVLEHLPLQREGQPATPPRCQQVVDMAERAAPGEVLVAAEREPLPTLGVTFPPVYGATAPERTPRWYESVDLPGTLVPIGQGVVSGELDLEGGTYQVWVKGGGGRPLRVLVDGRGVGEQAQINTPGQWLPLGRVQLEPGAHHVELRRPGGGLAPGDAVDGLLGGIAFEPQAERPLVEVAPERARRLCGEPWDWIERVAR